jgi:hypothetical protein
MVALAKDIWDQGEVTPFTNIVKRAAFSTASNNAATNRLTARKKQAFSSDVSASVNQSAKLSRRQS